MSTTRFFSAAVILLAGAVSSCSSDDKSSSTTSDALATRDMATAIQTIIALGAGSDESAVDLSACPLGDFDALVSEAPTEVQAMADPDAELFTYVFQPTDDLHRHLQCGRAGLGMYTGEVPAGDYRDDLTQILADFVVTFDDDRAFRGGTIVRFCAEVIGAGDGAFCEADWYDGNIWVGVFMDDDARSAELAEQWLLAVLDDVISNVPLLSASMQLRD